MYTSYLNMTFSNHMEALKIRFDLNHRFLSMDDWVEKRNYNKFSGTFLPIAEQSPLRRRNSLQDIFTRSEVETLPSGTMKPLGSTWRVHLPVVNNRRIVINYNQTINHSTFYMPTHSRVQMNQLTTCDIKDIAYQTRRVSSHRYQRRLSGLSTCRQKRPVSNPRSVGHFGGRGKLAVAQLVTLFGSMPLRVSGSWFPVPSQAEHAPSTAPISGASLKKYRTRIRRKITSVSLNSFRYDSSIYSTCYR